MNATIQVPPPTEKQHRILGYLREQACSQRYFKSRRIGDALGLSPHEVGTNIAILRDRNIGLTIEKWGYSTGTTWKVTV